MTCRKGTPQPAAPTTTEQPEGKRGAAAAAASAISEQAEETQAETKLSFIGVLTEKGRRHAIAHNYVEGCSARRRRQSGTRSTILMPSLSTSTLRAGAAG